MTYLRPYGTFATEKYQKLLHKKKVLEKLLESNQTVSDSIGIDSSQNVVVVKDQFNRVINIHATVRPTTQKWYSVISQDNAIKIITAVANNNIMNSRDIMNASKRSFDKFKQAREEYKQFRKKEISLLEDD